MAFQQFKLDRSVNQTRGIFDKYIYNPDNNDLLVDILAVGYFDQSRFVESEDWIGSLIEISASDGYAIARIVSGGVVALYNSNDTSGGGTTYQSLTDTESFMGNAKKVPLVSDAETEMVYATNFTFDDTNGWIGIGTTPSRAIDVRGAGEVSARIRSNDGKAVMVLDGVAIGDGANVGEISFRDNSDSIAIIDGERDVGAQSGSLNFRTQTDLGVMTSHMKIDSKGSFFLYDLAETAALNPILRQDPASGEIKYDTTNNFSTKAPVNQLSVATGDQWINAAQISGVPVYAYTEAAISAPGLILLDNTDLSLVTQITISKESLAGADFSSLFGKLRGFDVIAISDFLDNTNFMLVNVTGEPTDSGLTYQIPVSVTDSNGALTTGELTSFSLQPTSSRAEAIQFDRLIDMESTDSTQLPTGTGVANAIRINYGAAQGTVSDPIMVDATGLVTVNESGLYRIKLALQYGRTGNAGVSELLFATFVNGVQAGRSIAVFINNANDDVYIENDNWVNIPAGTQIEYRVMRDVAGNDSGGLIAFNPTVDGGNEWNAAPCAALRIERMVSCDGTGGMCF